MRFGKQKFNASISKSETQMSASISFFEMLCRLLQSIRAPLNTLQNLLKVLK
jgi:hypothetical protein